MRFATLIMMLIMISSCGVKNEKAGEEKNAARDEYLRKGGEIVNLSQAELLKNVGQAMSAGGPEFAIDFCNVHALSIKDSLSALYDCEIRRISLKYRNPDDKPQTEKGMEILNHYQEAHLKGESIEPVLEVSDNYLAYYHPILIKNEACLLCHGIPGEQITDETMAMINAHYPADLATGFRMGDFRGAWKVTFKE